MSVFIEWVELFRSDVEASGRMFEVLRMNRRATGISMLQALLLRVAVLGVRARHYDRLLVEVAAGRVDGVPWETARRRRPCRVSSVTRVLP